MKKERIEYEMGKTGALNSIKITPQIQEILDYFKSISKGTKFIIPILKDEVDSFSNEDFKREISRKTALVSRYLKMIAKEAGIEKKVT